MIDTIYALSSGHPPAAIAVLRISGPAALDAGAALAGRLPSPRRAGLRALRDTDGALLDRALVLVFPGPSSATGEDLVELHCHGGRAVVAAVERALAGRGLRRADPGEFTRRALLNGRVDLTQAEGLADLLEAETETQRLAALDGAGGRVAGLIDGWATRVATLAATVEASLDFADEDDVADDPAQLAAVTEAMRALASEIEEVLAAPSVERLRDGLRVVIAGPPNAGKSTLLNRLAGRDAAIVSPVAGTTRDRIEAPVSRAGEAYVLIDTAGLTETLDPVEAIGVERAAHAIEGADLLLWLGEEPPPGTAIWVQARADLPGRRALLPGRTVTVAAAQADDIERLWRLMGAQVVSPARAGMPVLRDRQRRCCRDASTALQQVDGIAGRDPLLVAEHLQEAGRALAVALGRDATEDMLDALFGRFCIGK